MKTVTFFAISSAGKRMPPGMLLSRYREGVVVDICDLRSAAKPSQKVVRRKRSLISRFVGKINK